MDQGTIHIVDSDGNSLKLAASLLRVEGYRVLLSSSAEEALTALQTTNADLMLVSAALPGMSGFDLAAKVKANRRTAQIKLVALLDSAGDAEMRNARAAGCEGFLTKPLDPLELGQRVREFLNLADDVFEGPEAQPVLPEGLSRNLSGKPIALVGFRDREAERLCAALGSAGASPRLFAETEAPESDAVRNCPLVLLQVKTERIPRAWLEPGAVDARRLVLVGQGKDLIGLEQTVQSRARDFLIDGCQPEEVLMRLGLILANPGERAPETKASVPAAPAAKLHDVVIVDDDANIRALVRAVLERHGTRCLLAANGEEGLAMVRDKPPAAVILDVNMPGLTGFEVLPRLRKLAPATKVLMLTANGGEADVVKGFALGADDYVSKPFQPNELAARVKRLL